VGGGVILGTDYFKYFHQRTVEGGYSRGQFIKGRLLFEEIRKLYDLFASLLQHVGKCVSGSFLVRALDMLELFPLSGNLS